MQQYDHIKTLFDSDSSLFEPWKLPEDWLDDWIITSPEDLDRLDTIYDNYESDELSEYSVGYRNEMHEQVNLPDAVRDYYRVGKWPATPNFNPPVDALAFHIPFHHSPDKYGIYIMEEGVKFLSNYFKNNSNGILSESQTMSASLYFIYFHEVFHHKVEMLATRWELVGRKPFYIDSLQDFYNEGKGTDDWPEEMLANVFAFEKCIKKIKPKFSSLELDTLKVALLKFISNMPEGYRKAIDIIVESGSLSKNFEHERFAFWERIYAEYMPGNKSYSQAVWMFGYFDYPLNKRNGKVNFLLPKGSLIDGRLSLNGRLLSTKQVIKKLKKLGVLKVRDGKGSHSIWECETGRTTIPLDKNDMPIGTLNSILKGLGFEMNVHEFLRC